jgi:RsiW-degrading membrane proteinase PrsW (M82 family)
MSRSFTDNASTGETPDAAGSRWAPSWWAVLLIGLLLWAASVGAAFLTSDLILLPTIVLLGSFLVPVTAVVWYLDHDPSPALPPRRIFSAFVIAGAVGVLAAALLEYYLVRSGLLGNLEVGLIEEFVKAVLIVVVARGIRTFHTRDGMVLGAAVGFGFAALESSGYALVSLFVVSGNRLTLSLASVVTTELVRGILAPFGHGMWTAIIGGVIFSAAARRGHLRLAWSIVGAYVLVAVLHAAFDSINGIIGYVVVSIIGLIPLVWLWVRSDGGGVIPRRRSVRMTEAGGL